MNAHDVWSAKTSDMNLSTSSTTICSKIGRSVFLPQTSLVLFPSPNHDMATMFAQQIQFCCVGTP